MDSNLKFKKFASSKKQLYKDSAKTYAVSMALNLLLSPWLSVVRRNGERELIAPWQVTDGIDSNPIVDLDAPRPSLCSTQFQFLLGVLQTYLLPSDGSAWRERYLSPPSSDDLKRSFESAAPFFSVGGDGPRFMQEQGLSSIEEVKTKGLRQVDGLPLGSPGGNTDKLNQDLFLKGGWLQGICEACAATSILERQLNAGGCGRGYRTSVRGGGPLNTFVWPSSQSGDGEGRGSLWHFLWANVLDAEAWPEAAGGSPETVLPWVMPRVGELAGPVTPANAHALRSIWGMPQRMLLDLDSLEMGSCDFCGTSDVSLVRQYWTTSRGENYEGGWVHPHSPYYLAKGNDGAGVLLPIHANRTTMGYERWPRVAFPSKESGVVARVVSAAQAALTEKRQIARRERWGLWVHGLEVDNASVSGFWSATAPLLVLPDGVSIDEIRDQAFRMVEGAGDVRMALVSALKRAWFSENKASKIKKLDAPSLDVPSVLFLEATESSFFRLLQRFSDDLAVAGDKGLSDLCDVVGAEWAQVLFAEAQTVFAAWAERGQADYDPRRSAEARQFLSSMLQGKKFLGTLGVRTNLVKVKPVKVNSKARN